MNNKSLAAFAVAYKKANVRNLSTDRKVLRDEEELRRITAVGAMLALSFHNAPWRVVMRMMNIAGTLGLEFESWEFGNVEMLTFAGERYVAHGNVDLGLVYLVDLYDRTSRHDDDDRSFAVIDVERGSQKVFVVLHADTPNRTLRIIQGKLANVNKEVHKALLEQRMINAAAAARAAQKKKNAQFKPTIPTTGPEQFVSNVERMFPSSPHAQALRRALMASSNNNKLASAGKAVFKLLQGLDGRSNINIAKTTNLLKVWRSYQNWHRLNTQRTNKKTK